MDKSIGLPRLQQTLPRITGINSHPPLTGSGKIFDR